MNNALFRPFKCKSLALANRVVMAPMTRKHSPGGIPGTDVAAYYRARALGGVGLILTEGTTIGRPAASHDSNIPNMHSPASLAGWRKVVEQVHAAGSKIGAQLWHVGALRGEGAGPHPDAVSEGPSSFGAHPHEMSEADIADTIEAFASAAENARDVGFDAVEIHGAHGYLVDQFMWNSTNRRTDRYGGDPVRRMQFAAEVVRAVRRRIGDGYAISFRLSQWKLQNYDARLASSPQELEAVLAPLVDAGVDLLHLSTRKFWVPEFNGSDLGLAGWAKKLTGLPTIAVGSIGLAGGDFVGALLDARHAAQVDNLDAMEFRLANDEFDLVAVGRAILSNPNWANLVRDGRQAELVPFDKEILATL